MSRDLCRRSGISLFAAMILIVMSAAVARAQNQGNQDQNNQSQAGQSQPNQNQTNQNQSNQDQPTPNQPKQDQTTPPQQGQQPAQEQSQQQPTQQQQQPPENPPANAPTQDSDSNKDNNNPNPAQAAAEATKDAAIKLGTETLVKVRDWEIGWATGPYVGRQRDMVPMTSEQRREIYLAQTFLEPSDYFKRMFSAAIDQARGSPHQWGGGFGGYGKRFASREGQFIIANSFAALGNAKLKYEPRYDQCRCTAFFPRLRHAIVRNFVTYNETEHEIRPQLALYGGAFTGGVISTMWKPRPRDAWTGGAYGMLGQAAYGSLLNLFIEFAGDINRKIGANKWRVRK